MPGIKTGPNSPDPQDEPTPDMIAEYERKGQYMPTRAQIAAEAAEIRKGWAPQTEAGRRMPAKPVDMEKPHVIGRN